VTSPIATWMRLAWRRNLRLATLTSTPITGSTATITRVSLQFIHNR